jgi:hypothetical protein
MAKTVKVTPAQVNAARLKVKRSAASGRFVSSSVSAIANAKRSASGDRMDSASGRHQSAKQKKT